jgi:2-amino-4-hydroxy-6-hydroxymethyldihydropteridine diphosphokinase
MPSRTPETVEVGLGFGSNVGDAPANVRAALKLLEERKTVAFTSISSIYRTAPWGVLDQQDFANACAVGQTALAPHALLDAVKRIEEELGRVETFRWGPRVIDIDILYYGDSALADERLVLPHKDLFQRSFVLIPLAEVAPDRLIGGRRVGDAARALGSAGVSLWSQEG